MVSSFIANKSVRGSLGAASKSMVEEMLAFMTEHEIHPVIAKTFEFEDAKEALGYAQSGRPVGKVVVRC